jgi:gamma-glutamylcyclotransferase (GGCT)/AIG2-like uncharacterized protein YtfP
MTRGELLFVYGTLLDERHVEALISGLGRWSCLGAARIAGELYDAGAYPALRLSAAGAEVEGILLEVENGPAVLAKLDDYEGVEKGLYARRRVEVRLSDGSTCEAWVYVYDQPVAGLRRIQRWPPEGAT